MQQLEVKCETKTKDNVSSSNQQGPLVQATLLGPFCVVAAASPDGISTAWDQCCFAC